MDLLLLTGPGGCRLAPWSAALSVHPVERVVRRCYQGHADGVLLVTKPRAHPPPPGSRGAPPSTSMEVNCHDSTQTVTKSNAPTWLSLVVVGGCGWGGVWCVVVVGLTKTQTTMSLVIPTQKMHLVWGAVSLWTRPPALYLCTGPEKIPTSTHHRADELHATSLTTGATAGARLSPPRRHLWNSLNLCKRDIDHLVEEELGNLGPSTNSLDHGNRPLHRDV